MKSISRPNDNKSADFPRLTSPLWSDLSPAFAYGIAALIAIAFIWHIYPWAFLMGSGRYFEDGDPAQHVSGWWYFVQDTWHFPLLHTQLLNYPEGVSIAFTDSIPLAALLLKPIASWLPAQFHYIGLWHAVAFFTQAIAAAFLIRALGVRHVLALVAAVVFAITWPALLFRGPAHTALMTHGIILCSLAFYFLGRSEQWKAGTVTAAFIVLSLVGLLVHPYFLAYCYALFLAFLADQALGGEGWKKQLPRLLISVFILCAVGAVLGYFGKGTRTGGFGVFSMNFLAPICAGDLGGLYSCVFDGTGGQGEGFNYFGAGVLLLLLFIVITQWQSVKAGWKKYPALRVVLILLFFYALSTRIYIGSFKLVSYSWPSFLNGLTGTFRVSGRFFWVIGYLVFFAALAALLKKPSWRGIAVLMIALCLQWIDGKPLRERLVQTVEGPATSKISPWKDLMAEIDYINIYPAFGCDDVNPAIYWDFQYIGAYYGKILDTGYIARPNANCENNKRGFEQAFKPRHLYIMPADYMNDPAKMPATFADALREGSCAQWQAAVLCRSGMRRDEWKKMAADIKTIDGAT